LVNLVGGLVVLVVGALAVLWGVALRARRSP
jgi:hypothetical protein